MTNPTSRYPAIQLLLDPAIQLLLAMVLLGTITSAHSEPINVGVVHDGDAYVTNMLAQLQQETATLMQGEFDVRFTPDYTVMTDGTAAGARTALDLLYRSAAVDLVIAAGPVASHVAVTQFAAGAPKPTVAPAILHASIQHAPLRDQASGVPNLNYIAYPSDIEADLRVFMQVADITHVAFLLAPSLRAAIPGLDAHYLAAAARADLQASIVDGSADAGEILAALPPAADAVFLAQPLGLDAAAFQQLAAGLIERRLPSFVAIGTSQVDAGMLVGLHSDADAPRAVRRLALNIQRILLGEPAAGIPVFFHRAERLTINAATARALGIALSWSVLTEAQLVGDTRAASARKLDLVTAVHEAMAANLQLAAQGHDVAAGRERVRETRALLLPRLELSGTGVLLDEALASPLQPEQTIDGSAVLTQSLYAEPAWAAWAAQKHLQRGREAQLQQARMDVAQAAATAYLNVLRAKTAERVQRQDLELTRSNLELARLRREIGFSGPAEVFRWESQIALTRIGVIDANARRNQAEIELNRLLHRPAEEAFETHETGLFDEDLVTHDERFLRFIRSKAMFRSLRDFMVEDCLQASVDLAVLDAAIEASARGLVSAQRAHWMPSVGVRAEAGRHLSRQGAGSDGPAPGGDANWNVGVSASLPLYSGGAKFAAASRGARELAKLQAQRAAVAEGIEARIRSSLHAAGASYAGISLAEDAAVTAARSLELVEDAYGRGVLSIIDLLDAQNASIVAEELAANAVFDFLVDLMTVERAMGKFYFFAAEEQRQAWFHRANAYIDSRLSQDQENTQ